MKNKWIIGVILLLAPFAMGADEPGVNAPLQAKINTASTNHTAIVHDYFNGIIGFTVDSATAVDGSTIDTFWTTLYNTYNADAFQGIFEIMALDSAYAADTCIVRLKTTMEYGNSYKTKTIKVDTLAVGAINTNMYKYYSYLDNDTLLWPATYFEVELHDTTNAAAQARTSWLGKDKKYKVKFSAQAKWGN